MTDLEEALTTEVLDGSAGLGPVRAEWDELAVAAARPFSAPAWGMSWWESGLRPRRAELRLVLVRDGDRLVGVLPSMRVGRILRPLGGGLAPVEPLALPGLERRVAAAFVAALAACEPAPIAVELERHGASPPWGELLVEAWPGGRGGWLWLERSESVPHTDFPDGFDAWFDAKSSSFRREMRRKRRRLEEAGGEFREATEKSLPDDVREFLRLHRQRLAEKGGTSLGEAAVEPMLAAVGADLLASGRFRLIMVDLDGEAIAAQLVVSAGGEVCAWNTGFDEEHARLSPLMLCMLRVVEEAAAAGERRVSLGPGGQAYKYRLCEEEDELRREVLAPRAAAYPIARLRLAPAQLRAWVRRRRGAARSR